MPPVVSSCTNTFATNVSTVNKVFHQLIHNCQLEEVIDSNKFYSIRFSESCWTDRYTFRIVVPAALKIIIQPACMDMCKIMKEFLCDRQCIANMI